MERLTKRIGENVYFTQGKYESTLSAECETQDVRNILHRLAAYEDTGLEPETVSKIRDIVLDISGNLDRLRELAQADRDGRCVVPPAGGLSDQDGENALKSAMNTCYHHNNPVTRFIADAVAEKLVRAEAALKERENNG